MSLLCVEIAVISDDLSANQTLVCQRDHCGHPATFEHLDSSEDQTSYLEDFLCFLCASIQIGQL